MPVVTLQLLCLGVFLLGLVLALRGADMVKTISKVAGIAVFAMMFLYILMIFAAPAINPGGHASELRSFDLMRDGIFPSDLTTLASASILLLAVGGCEKIAPYVKSMKNPGKGFPKGMLLLVIMVFITAVLGTIAMNSFYNGMDFMGADNKAAQADFIANGQYQAFCKLGAFYGVGDTLMFLYAAANALAQFAAIIISIDAPLRILLGNADENFIPK